MSQTRLKTVLKYLCLVVADIVSYFAIPIIYLVLGRSKGFQFAAGDLYLLFGLPIYLFLRGMITRIIFKKVWWPNLVFLFEVWLTFPLTSWEFEIQILFSATSLIISAVAFLISTIGSLITAKIIKIVHLKKSQN